jgi:hypothetical protein
MSVFPSGAEVRGAFFGTVVVGAAKTIPATGLQTIFNVLNGRILLTSLSGVVTTVIGGTATTLSVGVTPAGGSSQPVALASATAITSSAVGTLIAIPDAVGGALVVAANGVTAAAGVSISSGGIALVSAGVITVTTSATTTGAIQWTMTYLPIDPSATVTAA